MGASSKNLEQIMLLTEAGLLPVNGRICDIGATELHGDSLLEGTASFLDYYAARGGGGPRGWELSPEICDDLTAGGFLGALLKLAGFKYVALDIFEAPDTILFDLNAHEPGPGLARSFDLVLNFGTTEHVVNQYLAHRTIYDLLTLGGVAYHDLPMSGYANHGYFKYDPQFLRDVAAANGADMALDRVSLGAKRSPPPELASEGLDWRDYGVEAAFVRRSDAPFRLPLETSTSLAVDPRFAGATSEQVRSASVHAVAYGPTAAAAEKPLAVARPPRKPAGVIERLRRKVKLLTRS
jgi:hypothetical protein